MMENISSTTSYILQKLVCNQLYNARNSMHKAYNVCILIDMPLMHITPASDWYTARVEPHHWQIM